jgi:hypothetical protein
MKKIAADRNYRMLKRAGTERNHSYVLSFPVYSERELLEPKAMKGSAGMTDAMGQLLYDGGFLDNNVKWSVGEPTWVEDKL